MTRASNSTIPGVQKILALRPNAVGDFVFALPALHALRFAYPAAEIWYVGKQWHADFLLGRPGPIDRVVVAPPIPGVGAHPEAKVDQLAVDAFVVAMRSEGFDLAVQMFGGGRYSNPFIKRLGARVTVGARTPDAEPLDRWIAYGDFNNRRLEMLEIAALAGATMWRTGRELQVTQGDRVQAATAFPVPPSARVVVVHPGSSDPRRRWPVERFAAVADALAQAGAVIAVNGTRDESALVQGVIGHMRNAAIDLTDALSLSGLCGVIDRAAMVLSNDSGPLHLALAMGTPCVGVYWLTNLMEACPLRQNMHRAAMSTRIHCPVCGQENRKSRCEHDVCFVDDVPVEHVREMALELFESTMLRT
ncbi:glycosyltransferase family 9 protein [Massilia soli]|uniref:Glycosyltransferase family 9 protein n=1 Tax=Massilia soli TaxID=2792854 RepID=A0ABS7SMP9_9BURK|nr:glycosyltransferase family 9 protein [Massilia soli]MBZ2206430.1 glycosyltransferase family 9 protein [Massilia soli]